ncbi:hypothetical protein D3C77_335200 [compost metagenome]
MPGGEGLDRNDQHPEPPVHPADGKARPGSDRLIGIGGERPGVRVGHGHLAEHAHHQNDQQAGQEVGQYRRRTGGGNGMPGADEQPGTDDAGN